VPVNGVWVASVAKHRSPSSRTRNQLCNGFVAAGPGPKRGRARRGRTGGPRSCARRWKAAAGSGQVGPTAGLVDTTLPLLRPRGYGLLRGGAASPA
jgi:hypothetical protein